MSFTALRDRSFVDQAARLEVSAAEAELADWCAARYGEPADGESLRWFCLYLLFRHGQGDLGVTEPDRDPDFAVRFAAMAPVDEAETADVLRRTADQLRTDFAVLALRNGRLFSEPEGSGLIVRYQGGCRYRRFWNREESLLTHLARLAPPAAGQPVPEDPLQKALALLRSQPLLPISGGPGTGKTTLIGQLVRAWREERVAAGALCRILLAAPTGRAASRLLEAMPAGEGLPETAETLHKLLGFRRDAEAPLRNRDYPLSADLVVVDEASMIDFNLLDALCDALPPEAHLVLVGDKDQLPSVGAGTLFADLLEGADREGHRFWGKTVLLDKIHRSVPGISRLAATVREGDADAAWELLYHGGESACAYRPLPDPRELPSLPDLPFRAAEMAADSGFDLPLQRWREAEGSIREGLDSLSHTGLLTPVRKGPFGTFRLNELCERLSGTLHGRPVMMTVNNYELELSNGDRGMIFLFEGTPLAVFRDSAGGLRGFPPGRLEGLETAYALTVHKSQGSEFRRVVLFYPDMPEGLKTREILYTGITRVRESLVLYSEERLIREGIPRRISRESRVRELLSGLTSRCG